MMKRLALIAALAVLGFAANSNAVNDDLESRVTASDGWVAYRVPMVAGVNGPCCYVVRGDTGTRKGCNLDRRSWDFDNDHADPVAALDGTLAVYLRVERGRVERVRAVDASCPVQTASTVRWIDPVNPTNSVAMLSALLDRKAADDPNDHGLVALAYHADASATRALVARAEPSHSFKEREQALFWLGQTRGAEGADIIQRYATTDADPELRAKAIFALSQLHDGAADEALIAVLRGDYPRAVKKQALFWLGQSGSPRAMAYFDEALK